MEFVTATSNWWFGPMIWINNLRVSLHNLSYVPVFLFLRKAVFYRSKNGENTRHRKKPLETFGVFNGNFWWLRTWFSSQNSQETPRLCVWKLCKRCANWRSAEIWSGLGVCEAFFLVWPLFLYIFKCQNVHSGKLTWLAMEHGPGLSWCISYWTWGYSSLLC